LAKDLRSERLVDCVRNPPTFAPNTLRGAWGLVVEDRAALLRTRQAGTRAPPALLRAVECPSMQRISDARR
jgi:hypothetical protein